MSASIDSNKSTTYINEEASLKVPGNGPWFSLEPNTYSDFGGDLKTVAREPISATRQRAKGTVTDLDVTAGWNEDFTQNNLTRLLMGFLFANARSKPSTWPITQQTRSVVSAVAATSGGGAVAQHFLSPGTYSWITLGYKVGHIVKSRNFTTAANNFVWVVTAVTATLLTVTPIISLVEEQPDGSGSSLTSALVNEGDNGKSIVEVVGVQIPPTSTLTGLSAADGAVVLGTTAFDMTRFGLIPGEWMFIGDNDPLDYSLGGDAGQNFILDEGDQVTVRGYARVKSVAAAAVTLDITMFENFGISDTASGYDVINVWFGTVIRNESEVGLIVRRTYSILRTLGQDVSGGNIYEHIMGAIANQFTLNIPSNNKLAADMTFVAMDTKQDALLPSGTFNAPLGEEPYNTSQDVFAMLLYVINPLNPQQVPLFGAATDEKITINNNTKPNKAIGVVGAFEASVGMLDVSGTLTCYFDDEKAVQAIRNNADVGLVNIFAKKNEGMLFDLPLLTLGGGRLKVEKDKPIMADITHTAASAAAGADSYTVLHNKFSQLPDCAMANYVPLVAD